MTSPPPPSLLNSRLGATVLGAVLAVVVAAVGAFGSMALTNQRDVAVMMAAKVTPADLAKMHEELVTDNELQRALRAHDERSRLRLEAIDAKWDARFQRLESQMAELLRRK